MPEPESDDLGLYLEDTITIDWQTPAVLDKAKELLSGIDDPESRVERLFGFVRDEIAHSLDALEVAPEKTTCRASEVLRYGTGLCYAKSHLLAGLLRIAGFPTGFCYMRLANADVVDRFTLHGFNAVFWKPTDSWIFLDARGNRAPDDGSGTTGIETKCCWEPPWRLAYQPDAEKGESFLPFIYRRPAKRIIDLLERAPSFDAVIRNLPDSI